MYSLLPEFHIRELLKEYRARLAIVTACAFGGVVLFSLALLLPAYVYIRANRSEIMLEHASLSAQRKDLGSQNLEQELIHANTVVREFAEYEHGESMSSVIRSLRDSVVSGIKIENFTIQPLPDKGEYTIVLSGSADTRESLVNFTESLSDNPNYSSVGLPISNLAKSSNIKFSMSFKATQ